MTSPLTSSDHHGRDSVKRGLSSSWSARQRDPRNPVANNYSLRLGVMALVALSGLFALGLAVIPGRAAHARSGQPSTFNQSSEVDPEPRLQLIAQDGVVAPDGQFTVFVEASGVASGSDLAVDIFPAVTTQSQLDAALDNKPRSSIGTFPVVELPGDPNLSPVRSGFVIDLWGRHGLPKRGGWAKRLTKAGVYPIRIRLRGPDNTTLTTVVTFLLRGPDTDEDVEPTPAYLLADIRSGTQANELIDNPTAPLGDDMVKGIATLTDLLGDHPTVPATISVTPEVVERLASTRPRSDADTEDNPSSTSATTTTSSGSTPPSSTTSQPRGTDPNDVTAAQAMDGLRTVLKSSGREVLGAPAQTIDPAELIELGLADELAAQNLRGAQILTRHLEQPLTSAWWLRTRLDSAAVKALTSIGIHHLLVAPDAVIGDQGHPASPVPSGGPSSRATVVEPALRVGNHSDPVLAANRLIGHLAALSSIEGRPSTVVTIQLPRTAQDAVETEAILTLLEANTFVDAEAISSLSKGPHDDTPVVFAPTTATTDADRSWAGDLRRTRSLVDSYSSMVPDQPTSVSELSQRLSLSADHRLDPDRRSQQVTGVREDVERLLRQVSIPPSDQVTLGNRDAEFPLVITSQSPTPLEVVVELTASDRLTIDKPRIEVLLDGEHTEVPIAVRSRLPGDTPLKVRVTTPDGSVLLSEGTYSVRSTAVSGVGLVLTVGAGLFLAIWWGRHIIRSRRPRGRHA
ncbi:MAG: DUF6049 family protein, partial [Acidimicrobiales bacterium]